MDILECFEYNQHFVTMMNVINRAKRENLEGKFEKHHIIPRCFYKEMNIEVDNSDKNLVKLTREQHCKVHHLAMLCAKEIVKNKLIKAFQLMTHTKGQLGYKHSTETKMKLSKCMAGKNNPMFGHHDANNKISESKKGKTKTDFGLKFKTFYGITKYENPNLYSKEYKFYRKNKKCSWE